MTEQKNPYPEFLSNSGEVGEFIQSNDWSDHPLGAYITWPPNLKTTLGIVLGSNIPMILFWGPNFNCFYNDAFVPFLDTQDIHTKAIGKKGEKVWPETWSSIKPSINQIFYEEKSIHCRELIPTPKENSWIYDINPVTDQNGDTDGVLVICQEQAKSIPDKTESQQDYEEKGHILESITDGFYEIDKNWVITSWNPEAENLLGIKREDILGEKIWDAFPEGKELKFYPEFKKVMNKRVPTSFEEYYEPWGKWFTFDVYPTKEGISAYFRDITEQRRLQLINERTEEISGVAGWEYDVMTKKIFMTPKAYEIYEISKVESLDLEINKKLFNKQSLDKIDSALKKAISHKKSYEIELTLTRAEENKIIRVNGFPQTEGAKVTKVYGTLEDVTQKKKDQEELEEAYEKLKTAHQIAKMGYWTHDLVEDKSEWTEEVYNIWERNPESFDPTFEKFLETIHPEDRAMFIVDAEEAFPDKSFYDSEHRIITPDGKVKWIMERITLHRDDEGNAKLLEGIAQDITEQKKQEEKIRETLKEKEILLAEVHHRVKNNLAVVSGMMQLQVFEETNEELKEKLLDSVVRIGSMATIHEQLYQSNNFSKLDFSENLRALVNKIIDTMQIPTDITLDLDLEPIQLNLNQAIPCSLIVNEIITNIIKHAFKGRETGKITINQSENNEQLTLIIRDNGVGFSKDFDIKNSNSLGYRLIDTLAKQLEATYSYTSPGKGTVFYIQFEKSEIKGIGSANI
ncbi:hypothetical protein CK503_04230 [Aliifodinibius salipaludis]|uniref:PAS domain S-box protein n=1 Tax=Fodinibius salipaludis TaxID=2032627 RepID=A0A2A2GCS9_9BACT|nr:PAS domain S-box protein [Aliifodinibius salipaludis]PAU94687.1 hypothetical protein CK503_04230 [Aliifodinibius salipaludis]